jgi:hypothetical protein
MYYIQIHSVIIEAVIVWACIRDRACVQNFDEKPLGKWYLADAGGSGSLTLRFIY